MMRRWVAYVAQAGFAAVLMTLCAGLPATAATQCVASGSVFDVPLPGFLKSGTAPNLVLDFGATPIAISPSAVTSTSSRLRIVMPNVGIPSDKPFKLRHVESGGGTKVIATARSCEKGANARGSGSSGSGSAASERATRSDVAAPSGGPEIVIVGPLSEVARAEALVSSFGGAVLRRTQLGGMGLSMTFVDLRGIRSLAEFRGLLAQRKIKVTSDRHQVYQATQGKRDYANQLVGIETASGCVLRRSVRVGIIDGPIDLRVPFLKGIALETKSLLGSRERPGSAQHATAIAGLIAGRGIGLAQGVSIFAATAFSRSGLRDIAKLEDIAEALDWMLSRKVELVNLSLAGPRNAALAVVIETASSDGMLMVAAAGNDGQPRVAFPASHPDVIAITAVDAAKRLYRQASTGAQIEFAAPGVDVAVHSRRGVKYQTGTSFAAAIATALVAREIETDRPDRDLLTARLIARAEDLGPVGRDKQFGFGLLKSLGCRN